MNRREFLNVLGLAAALPLGPVKIEGLKVPQVLAAPDGTAPPPKIRFYNTADEDCSYFPLPVMNWHAGISVTARGGR